MQLLLQAFAACMGMKDLDRSKYRKLMGYFSSCISSVLANCRYMPVCAGTRQSRRLAALAEAQPHSPPEAHTLKQQTSAGSAQATEAHTHGQGSEPAASNQGQSMTGSAALLQASTLEASANVLKGLVSLHPAVPSCIQAFHS